MTYKIIDCEQGSDSWLSLRRTKITATDAGVIMGLNPWKTPLQLWEEKLGLREPQAVNDKMREGSLMEGEARVFFNEKLTTDFKPVVLESCIHPFMMASLDGMDHLGRIMEIKCGKGSHELALQYEIPPYYMSQLQKQMYVSDINFCFYCSYRSKEDNIFWTVNRDDAFIEKMIEAEKEFYRCMMEFQAPPATDRDYTNMDSRDWRLHTEVWKSTKAQIKLLEAKEECLRNELIAMCDGKSSQGNGVRVSKQVTKGRIDYTKIEELKNIDVEKYRGKAVTSYRFTETRDKDE